MLYSDCDSMLSDNVHQILTGTSPLITEHVAATDSSRFICSSPNENGMICGRTIWWQIAKFQWKDMKLIKMCLVNHH